MNITKEQADKRGIKMNLEAYQIVIQRVLGLASELLFSYNTYQFTDYKKYESSIFSEEEKGKYKPRQFPVDCENAFNMGKRLVMNI